MENPISTVTGAAKSALTIRNILVLLFGLLALFAVADLLGKTSWITSPVSTWRASRGSKTSAAPVAG